jgi:hypothetical protein
MAQEKTKQKEIGLVFNNFDNFGLSLKTGNEKSLWRFNTLMITSSNQDEISESNEIKQKNIGFGIKFGKEYRKEIVENFEFRYGLDLSFNYYKYEYENTEDYSYNYNQRTYKKTTYQPGINLVFGFNYVINDNIVIGAELLPHFSYITGTSTNTDYNFTVVESDISGISYGLSNTSALLSISYRFRK